MRRRNKDLPLTADVNITSLVDVAFTLLVIFIITAPVIQGGIEVEMPEADVPPLRAEDDPFFVTIDAQDRIFVEDTEVSPEEFAGALPQMIRVAGTEFVYIKGDANASYGTFMHVFAEVLKTGVAYGVVAQPSGGSDGG